MERSRGIPRKPLEIENSPISCLELKILLKCVPYDGILGSFSATKTSRYEKFNFLRDKTSLISSTGTESTMASRLSTASQNFEFNRIAMSENGNMAVLNRHENCIVLYGKGTLDSGDPQWMARKLTVGLIRPYDVCFAPHNHLVVSDNGDNSVKIFNLEEGQKQLSQIVIGHDHRGDLIVQDVNGMENGFALRVLQPLLRTLRIPQNIVIGPGPLSQLYVSSGKDIVLINMDWNKLIPISYFLVSSFIDWIFVQCDKSLVCDNVSTVQDHNVSHKVGGFNPLAITKAQFCAMFYHVTETRQAEFRCLQRSECSVGRRGDKKKFAETVVVYVRAMDENGRLIFHARYGNCYEGAHANTIHAEYFMLADDDFRKAVKILRDQKGGYIDMYMNKQPCFRSTGHTKKTELKVKECAKDLTDFYNLYFLPHDIKLTINLCQLYKVDMSWLPHDRSLAQDITNAQLGLKIILSSGIQLKAMTEESWRKLAEFASIELPQYQGSSRQKLDSHVHNVLTVMKTKPIFPPHCF